MVAEAPESSGRNVAEFLAFLPQHPGVEVMSGDDWFLQGFSAGCITAGFISQPSFQEPWSSYEFPKSVL